jgi:hypothetical protein
VGESNMLANLVDNLQPIDNAIRSAFHVSHSLENIVRPIESIRTISLGTTKVL